MRSRTARRTRAALLLLAMAVVPAAIVAWQEFARWFESPLGPALAVEYTDVFSGPAQGTNPQGVEAANVEHLVAQEDGPPAAAPAAAERIIVVTPSPSLAAKREPMCGGPPSLVILAAGMDSRTEDVSGRTDVIRAVRVDFVNAGVTLLAFPRDLWVTIAGLEDKGIYEQRVNAAFVYGDLYRGDGMGPSVLAQTLYANFGLVVDRYVALTMSSFAEAVDALGGVDFYLDKPVDGRSQGLIYFGAGWHHLNGDQVVKFSRIRYPDTDFHRIQRQTDVLMALRDRALEPENWAKIPGLVKVFLDDMQTDLSGAEIASLICLAPNVKAENIRSLSVERGMVSSWTTSTGANVLLPHEDQIRELVAGFMRGDLAARASE